MKTPIFGGRDVGRSRNLAYNRMVNLLPEMVDTKDGKAVGALYGTPGYSLFANVGTGPIRALYTHTDGTLYVLSGNELYTVSSAGAGSVKGAVYSTSGPAQMADNGSNNQVLVVDGQTAWCLDTASGDLTNPLPGALGVTPAVLAYQDGVAVVNYTGTNQWYQSNLGDFSTWQALNFSSADSTPDPIVSMFDLHREVWLFKQRVTEVWVNAGINGFVFQRLQGVQMMQGCAAAYSLGRLGDSLIWLGSDEEGNGVVYMSNGYEAQRVSDHSTEYAIQGFSTISDAIGFVEQEFGHYFYWLSFPTAGRTFVFDLTTKLWHERASFANGTFGRHVANCHAFAYGKHLIGDYESGNIYSLSNDVYTDNGNVHKWLRTWRALPPNKISEQPVTFNCLQIDMQSGISVTPGANPQYMLRWSDDGGHTWSNEMWSGGNQIGDTGTRVIFQRLGSTKRGAVYDRLFELSGIDPAPVGIVGAYVDLA